MSETDRILNDIRAYLRVSAAAASRQNAVQVIDSAEKAGVYAKLDGEMSQARLEQVTGIANQTLSRWLAEFVQEGIASPPNQFYKCHKAFYALQELGVNIALLKKRPKGASKGDSSQQPENKVPDSLAGA